MNKKSIFTVLLSLFVLSSCVGQTEVSRETATESETAIISENDTEPSQAPESESETIPIEATVPEETTPAEETKPFFSSEEDEAAFAMLGDYHAKHTTYPSKHVELHISDESWKKSEDYELFREYFFGIWEKEQPQSWETPLIIDDSEKDWFAENWRAYVFFDFYKVGEDVLVFQGGNFGGGMLYWLSKNEPDILYAADGAPGESPNAIYTDGDGFPYVWVYHKSDAEPNEPQNNYLSIYRLREMAKKHGIDYSLLVDFEWNKENIIYYHDDRFYFNPMYLVSETDDRIEIATQVGGDFSVAINIRVILQRTDGEWTREVVSVE
ncbi:MAG: hypothetical protein NC084_02475 [Bacteroides sp.]|nr:hypothetical protein [Eubacterium sp.]MCM1418417.1 hypothetical protein [Roseburia sp.]MCM1461561.1 hypothetical protein [Bacteroides sp.]